MRHRSLSAMLLAAVSLAQPLSTPAAAQGDGGLTLDQVEGKYRGMNAVHILKCDQNSDQLFNRTEMACVRGIYQAMYISD